MPPAQAGPPSAAPPTPADLSPPAVSENAEIVLRRRYLRTKDDGTMETPSEMLWRVASGVAAAETQHAADAAAWARRFYDLMATLRFLPATPTLLNAGRPHGQLAACFVLPVEPDGILEAVRQALDVHRTGGGTGFDLSALPGSAGEGTDSGARGAATNVEGDGTSGGTHDGTSDDTHDGTHGRPDGPLTALRLLDAATEEIKQGGARRGANMGVLRVDHPDIDAFVDVKRDVTRLPNFNLSVAITDDFLDAVARAGSYDLVDPVTGRTADTRNARAVWRRIAECAWATGEPGLVFVDRMNDTNPMRKVETIGATNPCGEQGLAPYDACNLGSIDLARHVDASDGRPRLDEAALEQTVRVAVRFLDDVIDVTVPPIDRIREKSRSNRRIGLGVMGLARALFRLDIPYGSADAERFVDHTLGLVRRVAHDESRALAATRGTFPAWEDSTWADEDVPMRNAAVTTIAPTGTIGMIADTSGGCEPEFSLVYTKHCLDGSRLAYVVPEFVRAAKREGFWHDGLLDELRANGGSARGLDAVPEAWQRVFVTAHDLPPEAHVRMQAACQRHVDNAVSKTINLPRDAKPDDVAEAFQLAYDLGCKGVTVYRDGARPDQVLRAGPRREPPADHTATPRPGCRVCAPAAEGHDGGPDETGGDDGTPPAYPPTPASAAAPAPPAPLGPQAAPPPRPRPPVVRATTHRIDSGCGTVYVTVGEDDEGPVEVIAVRARGSACTNAHLEATSRMASLALRARQPLETVARALRGVRCGEPLVTQGGVVLGCVDAVGQALERQALGPAGPQHEVFQQAALDMFGRQQAAPAARTAND